MRPRVIMVLALVAIVAGGVLLVPAAYARFDDTSTTATESATGSVAAAKLAAPPPPTLAAAPVSVQIDKGFFSWALLDRGTGKISGAPNLTATNTTESMIKVWLVSDYLRRLGDKPAPAARLKQASSAIINSDDSAAEALFQAGGGKPVIDRLIDMCGLTETQPVIPPGYKTVWWSYTKISAEDAVRMGECIKNGTAAGPKWTTWVLEEMTKVQGSTAAKDQQLTRGGGRWGIIDGLPKEIVDQGPIAIKNGWTMIFADGLWHVNCLAVADKWVLAVLLRYPQKQGLDYGADVCSSVATQLVTAQPGAALKVPVPVGKTVRAGGAS
ncbi:hypothetical protein AB0J90_09850 [Micromonospora sp. NPDC049523]|uniref:hypothetical protein n=1 Tax=Micromonospora sp. NPDC049523 TaxID=3155921 RepID=UPI003424A0F0